MDTQADDAVQDSLELDKMQAETLRDKLQLNCEINTCYDQSMDVVADSGYGSEENYEYLLGKGITPYENIHP